MLRALSLPLLSLLLSGCFHLVQGDGDVVSETRPIDAAVTRIDNFSELRVELVRADVPSLEVRVDKNLQGIVRTEVHGDRLVIDTHCECSAPNVGVLAADDAVIRVTLPQVTEFSIFGSGDVEALALAGESFLLEIDGSGDALLAGSVGRLDLRINGSGDIDARGLAATDADVKINGSGDVRVKASGVVNVQVNGSGDVRISGRPARVERSVLGSGDVTVED